MEKKQVDGEDWEGRIGKGGMRRRAREMDKGDGDALSI